MADALTTAVMGAVIAALAAALVAGLLGMRGVEIKSGSMTPTIAVGSLVVSRSVHPLQVHPGQVVTFRDPALGQQLVTHRVVQVRRVGSRVDFVTKGDANVATEHWNVPVSGTLGREVFAVPGLGRALAEADSRQARLVEIGLSVLLLAYVALRWVWRDPQGAPDLSTT